MHVRYEPTTTARLLALDLGQALKGYCGFKHLCEYSTTPLNKTLVLQQNIRTNYQNRIDTTKEIDVAGYLYITDDKKDTKYISERTTLRQMTASLKPIRTHKICCIFFSIIMYNK